MNRSYVYILECCDGSYYTGSTTDLHRRIEQHQEGVGSNYTIKKLPVKLVYYEEFLSVTDAAKREKQIQGWRREKKIALIKRQFHLLPELSKNYTDRKQKK